MTSNVALFPAVTWGYGKLVARTACVMPHIVTCLRGRSASVAPQLSEPCCIRPNLTAGQPYAPQDELARIVTLEQGKTLGDARGDVFRGLGADSICCHMS